MFKVEIKLLTSITTRFRIHPEVPPGKASQMITHGGFDVIRIM